MFGIMAMARQLVKLCVVDKVVLGSSLIEI